MGRSLKKRIGVLITIAVALSTAAAHAQDDFILLIPDDNPVPAVQQTPNPQTETDIDFQIIVEPESPGEERIIIDTAPKPKTVQNAPKEIIITDEDIQALEKQNNKRLPETNGNNTTTNANIKPNSNNTIAPTTIEHSPKQTPVEETPQLIFGEDFTLETEDESIEDILFLEVQNTQEKAEPINFSIILETQEPEAQELEEELILQLENLPATKPITKAPEVKKEALVITQTDIRNLQTGESLMELDIILGVSPNKGSPIWAYIKDKENNVYLIGESTVSSNFSYSITPQDIPQIAGEVSIIVTQIKDLTQATQIPTLLAQVPLFLYTREVAINVKPALSVSTQAKDLNITSGGTSIPLINRGIQTAYVPNTYQSNPNINLSLTASILGENTSGATIKAFLKSTGDPFAVQQDAENTFKLTANAQNLELGNQEIIISATNTEGDTSRNIILPFSLKLNKEKPRFIQTILDNNTSTPIVLWWITILLTLIPLILKSPIPLLGKESTSLLLGILLVFELFYFTTSFTAPFLANLEQKGLLNLSTTNRTEVISTIPAGMNPFSIIPSERSKLSKIYEPLIALNENFLPKPKLAVSWTFINDKTWEIHLRKNVRFHNGKIFTAQDVIHTFKAIQERKESITSLLTNIKDIQQNNNHLITITTKKPDPLLLYKLSNLSIISSSDVHSLNSVQHIPNGTGEYKYVYSNNAELILTRNQSYYKPKKRNTPQNLIIKGVVNKFAKANLAVQNIASSILDIPKDIIQKVEASSYTMQEKTSTEAIYLLFDTSNPVLTNLSLRKSLSKAIDKKKLGESLDQETFPIHQFVNPGMLGFNGKIANNQINLTTEIRNAKNQISASGATKSSIPLYFSSDLQDTALALQSQLEELGLTIAPVALKGNEYLSKLSGKVEGLHLIRMTFTYGDASEFLEPFITADGGLNNGSYSSEKVDSLINRASTNFSFTKRLSILQEVQQIITQENPAGIPLLAITNLAALKQPYTNHVTEKTIRYIMYR
jgi:peptide/nickel transport system substrate-binding protein